MVALNDDFPLASAVELTRMLSLGSVDMHKILRIEVRRYGNMEVWTHVIVLNTPMTIFHTHILLGRNSFSHGLEDRPDSVYSTIRLIGRRNDRNKISSSSCNEST